MRDRQHRLLLLIEQATGQAVYRADRVGGEQDAETDEDTAEAELTIAA